MDLQSIKTVYETSQSSDCNKLLKNGWELLAVNLYQNGDIEVPVSDTKYILGNSKFIDTSEVTDFLHPPKYDINGWKQI